MIRSKFAGMVLVVCFLLLCGSTAWAEGSSLRFEVQRASVFPFPTIFRPGTRRSRTNAEQ